MKETMGVELWKGRTWRDRCTNLFFEQRDMENWMDLRVMWEMETISHKANSFLNLKWSIKLGCKFVRMTHGYRLLPIRLQLEEDPIFYHKFMLCATFIINLFHSVLSKL